MNKWFKFFSADYLVDGKIRKLSPCERSCWITLLCLADTSDMPGEIKHLNECDLMEMSGLDFQYETWDETKGIMDKLEGLSMLKRSDNGMITICNFRKRQGGALSAYERVKKYRMKRSDNAMITHETKETNDNGIEEKRREENNIPTNVGDVIKKSMKPYKETVIEVDAYGEEVNKVPQQKIKRNVEALKLAGWYNSEARRIRKSDAEYVGKGGYKKLCELLKFNTPEKIKEHLQAYIDSKLSDKFSKYPDLLCAFTQNTMRLKKEGIL
ncbi:MAG: hypothetical protein AAB922_03045 [Patescibacteria group bacterium]